MEVNQILIGIILLGMIVFFGGFIVKKTSYLVKLALRGTVGGSCIWAVGMLLGFLGVQSPVGLNLITVAVSAFLGMPGILMLYVMGIYAL